MIFRGDKLKAARLAKNLTTQQLATMCNISQSKISYLSVFTLSINAFADSTPIISSPHLPVVDGTIVAQVVIQFK